MPTLEVLAEVMEESGKGISIATVDCTVFKNLCTSRFNIRVNLNTNFPVPSYNIILFVSFGCMMFIFIFTCLAGPDVCTYVCT